MDPNDPKLKSFIQVPRDSHFPIQNLPYGVFTTPANYSPRVGVAIGDQVLDLSVLEQAGLLEPAPGERLFNRATLNAFIEHGPDTWARARQTLSELLRAENPRLRDDARLRARAFAPHLAPEEYPAEALTIALYREGGIRAVEIGGVMFGRPDPSRPGREILPDLDLVRLAVPRRVYTNSHLEYVADVVRRLHRQPEKLRGVRIVRQAPVLRHFTAEFELV